MRDSSCVCGHQPTLADRFALISSGIPTEITNQENKRDQKILFFFFIWFYWSVSIFFVTSLPSFFLIGSIGENSGRLPGCRMPVILFLAIRPTRWLSIVRRNCLMRAWIAHPSCWPSWFSLCYIKGQPKKKSMKNRPNKREKETLGIFSCWCCVRSGSSRPTATVTWSIKLWKPKSQSPSFFFCPTLLFFFSLTRLLPSQKSVKVRMSLCIHTHDLCTHTATSKAVFWHRIF